MKDKAKLALSSFRPFALSAFRRELASQEDGRQPLHRLT